MSIVLKSIVLKSTVALNVKLKVRARFKTFYWLELLHMPSLWAGPPKRLALLKIFPLRTRTVSLNRCILRIGNAKIWLCVFVMSHASLKVSLLCVVAWMSKNALLETGAISKIFSDCNGIQTHNILVRKGTLNHIVNLDRLTKCLSVHLGTMWLCLYPIAVTKNVKIPW